MFMNFRFDKNSKLLTVGICTLLVIAIIFLNTAFSNAQSTHAGGKKGESGAEGASGDDKEGDVGTGESGLQSGWVSDGGGKSSDSGTNQTLPENTIKLSIGEKLAVSGIFNGYSIKTNADGAVMLDKSSGSIIAVAVGTAVIIEFNILDSNNNQSKEITIIVE
ncbi:MAG: hypothetical protein FWD32_03005 [Firmicutes bacterium]|nr:hypothetical protein [Bacillota bacterium]